MIIPEAKISTQQIAFPSEIFRKIAVVFLVLLNFIGGFKNNDIFTNLPIDITALLTGFLILFAIFYLFANHKIIRNTNDTKFIIPLILFVLLFITSCIFNLNIDSKYSTSKAMRFMTITFACIFIPFLIIKNDLHLQLYFQVSLFLGIVMCYATLFSAVTSADLLYRSSGLGSNPIAAARLCGFIFMYYIFSAQKNKFIGLFNAIFLAILPIIAIIFTGSRGPLIFTFLTVIVTYVIFETNISKKIMIPLIVSLFLVIVIILPGEANSRSVDASSRVSALFSGERDESTDKRSEILEVSLIEIPKYPFGIGIGAFENYNLLEAEQQYPHNVVLEVALELGWLPGIVFIYIISLSIYCTHNLIKIKNTNIYKLVFCSLIFYTLNMLISGELNGERSFWTLISIAISLYINRRAV